MQSFRAVRWGVAAGLLLVIAGLFGMETAPGLAQNPFATNTPRPASEITPTPDPAVGPDAPSDQYALRLWLEPDLVRLAADAVESIAADDARTFRAVQMLQYELSHRFPGSPSQAVLRDDLLQRMLAAPRGTVDMRALVRSYIQEVLNTQGPVAEAGGFAVQMSLVNLDIQDPLDVLVHTLYPAGVSAPAELRYEDYFLMRVDSSGRYQLLTASPVFPVSPYGDVEQISVETIGDLNNDSRDEVALSLRTGSLNKRMMIYGLRNDQFTDLVVPGRTLEYGEIISFLPQQGAINVYHYRYESEAWGCIGEIEVNWTYSANLFRPIVVDPNRQYQPQDSLACRLYAGEPYFSILPTDAVNNIQLILSQASRDEPDSQFALDRAEMLLAMLYALDGQLSAAQESVRLLQARAEPGSWLAQQTEAFTTTLGQSGTTALDLCAALLAASEQGACDIDAVLGRAFEANPLSRGRPVVEQLEERGLPVLETVTISEIGRANREAVNFNLYGASWWAFAPLGESTYTAERIDPPGGFAVAAAPIAFVEAPDNAYNALFGNDPLGALAALNNAATSSPGAPLSPSARYLQAVSYDLSGDRRAARDAYYNLWKDFPTTLWARLAAAHIERR